jgi:hypothetical protein
VGKEEEMVRLSKNILLIFSVLFFISTFSFAEEITITNYYPSTYGSYRRLSISQRLALGNDGTGSCAGSNWINQAITGQTDGTFCNDAAIFVPLYAGAQSDLRLYIVDDADDRFSIWGNSCGGGSCGDLNSATNIATFRADGNVGIGTTAPVSKLTVSPNTSMIFTGGGLGYPALSVGAYGANPANGIGLFVHDTATGYVGWVGAIRSGNENLGGWGSKTLRFQVPDGGGGVINALTIKGVTGNVGIGTIAPDVKMHIVGSNIATKGQLMIQDPTTQQITFWNAGSQTAHWYYAGATGLMQIGNLVANSAIDFEGGGNMRLAANSVYTSGAFGVGSTPGGYTCYINGSGYLNAAAWVYSSDIRLKENISYIQSGLNIIEQLKPAKFDYKNGEKKQAGFIAQEVEKVLPDIITKGQDGMLGMMTESIIPYLVKAIQEQQKQIEALEIRLNSR